MELFFRKNRDPVFRSKSITGFSGAVFDRDHDRDCSFKIADRFSYENRDPILRSVSTCGPETVFQSLIDFKMKNANRF
jgi:hypothetical protein